MKVEQLQIPIEEALAEWRAYKELLKKPIFQHEQYVKDLQSIYGHMKHGRAIIDIWEALKKAGVKSSGNPKLAICRADSKNVRFTKWKEGKGCFYREHPTWHYQSERWKPDVEVPEGTFSQWKLKITKQTNGVQTWDLKQIIERDIETIVPIIPAKFLLPLRGSLKNYHILWEVKKWKPVPPVDPILLRKLTPNMFVVLATWDLSPLERAVIKGRLNL